MSGSITVGQKTLASHDNSTDKLSLHNNVAFPAGHIVQVAHNSKGDENSDTTSSTSLEIVHDASNNNEWFVNISNITTGNKILLMFTFCTMEYGPGVDAAFGGYGICRDSLSNIVVVSSGANAAGVNTQAGAAGVITHNVITLSALDTPTSSSHSYYLIYRVNHSQYSIKIRPDTPAQFFAMEVQQ
tara:strand:- start:2898 stop:3455 length:558 start_codon:yes stop_codon:yes gene_type:complete